MSLIQSITDLLGLQGWEVVENGVAIEEDCVVIAIARCQGTNYCCGGCGQGFLFAYDHLASRRVRDFPVCGRRCYVEFTPARVACEQCGVHVETLDWVDGHQRCTLRYERYVAALCGILPALDVAELEGLDKNTVYRIDRKWLTLREHLRQDKPVRYLGIDEIAIRKGHRYATVFYDLERREVIGLVRDRTQRRTSSFFRRWGKEQCRQVVAVCMDLWAAYQGSVGKYCKQAAVVFDKFHVYGYLTQAIDEVRREEQRLADQAGRQLIKGSRWLWLRRPDRLRRKEKQTLKEIVALNDHLHKAYLLREDFEGFYACEDKASAQAFMEDWIARCKESGLKPFVKLAKRLKRWLQGILAYFEYHITNAVSEGINNKIKVLKRRSYGFHDVEYFFLKILDATGALPPLATLSHTF
jgi:transposase